MSNISTMASKMSSIMTEQQKGSEHMLERVGEFKEIAEITKRSTEEQASGTGMMSKNVELASAKISSINTAALEQQSVNDTIVSAIDDIRNLGNTTLQHVDAMNEPLQKLVDEINSLKKAMDSFKVE
jgi:methyl-accepting chemotaxis protein